MLICAIYEIMNAAKNKVVQQWLHDKNDHMTASTTTDFEAFQPLSSYLNAK